LKYRAALAVSLSVRVPHKTASGHGNSKGNVSDKFDSCELAAESRSTKILF
jgi:hypothetical protein